MKITDDVMCKTFDGVDFPEKGAECLMSILAACPLDWLNDGEMAALKRITKNFIGFNTKEDIDTFIMHSTAVKLTQLISSMK